MVDCLPAGHTILEQADMLDGRVMQTVRIDASRAEYQRIVHADEAYPSDKPQQKVTLALWEKKLLVRSVPMGKVHYRSDSFGDIISWLEGKGFKYQHGTRGVFTRERPTVEGA